MASKLNNVLICYHGCVPQNQTPLTYREHPDDIKAHVTYLLSLGYTFVLPELYSQWQAGTWAPDYPIACIHLDDGLESIALILPWMIDNTVPFGLAIIGRRQRLRLPEADFVSWATLKTYVDSSLCELMSHTYNMHHLTVGDLAGTSQPIMQGPWFEDNGIVAYRDTGDTRPIWDLTFIDDISWGLPFIGTDAATLNTTGTVTASSTPITTTITFTAAKSMSLALIRFWAALGAPSGSGYDAHVQISVNSVLVYDGIFAPAVYSTRTQWVEREMATITFDTPFALTLGSVYTLEIKTLNAGPGLFRIYAMPDPTGTFTAMSSCVSVKPGVSTGNAIIDYPAGTVWPAKPVMILGDGTGALVSEATHAASVQADLLKNNNVIANYLNAVWTEHKSGFRENFATLFVGVAFGTYSTGYKADSAFRYDVTTAHTAETLAFKFVVEIGPWYPIDCDCYIGTSSTGPWVKVANFAPNYSQRFWQEINLTTPYAFAVGSYWVRFVTKNATPYATATLLRIYTDRNTALLGAKFARGEGSDWVDDGAGNGVDYCTAFIKTYAKSNATAATPKRMVYPFGAYAEGGSGPSQIKNTADISAAMKVVMAAVGLVDGQGTWPTANRVEGSLNEPGIRRTKWAQSRLLMYGDSSITNSLNNIAAYCGALWRDVEHSGVKWQTSMEPDPGGNATIRYAYGALNWVDFDAFYFNTSGGLYKSKLNDGGSYLSFVSTTGTLSPGQTITGPTGAAVITWFNGDVNNPIAKVGSVTGLFSNGETWTTATGAGVLDVLETFPDDKGFLQSRGIKCLLYVTNHSFAINDFDGALSNIVVSSPASYVTAIVNAVLDNGWDGAVVDIENVYQTDRAAATAFIIAVADALHAQRKLCHIAVPAITGTAYDNLDWTGWCDYTALIQRVDMMHVMTYTETGPGSEAGPHAPSDFWNLVYHYIITTIPARFRKRVLVGCNAYAHVWDDNGNVDYASYWDALAQGLLRGALITNEDGEATWDAFGYSAWMGTPDTHSRAVNEAILRRFGGIGSWKADDGDRLSFFPQYPQLGRTRL